MPATELFGKTRQTVLLTVFLTVFFIGLYQFLSPRTQSIAFTDENEHLVPGWMMVNFSRKLYTDLTTNHQPIPILLATTVFTVFKPPNLFMTIERTRQLLFLTSFLGAAVLTWRFGTGGLLAAMAIEVVKFYLFGSYLLAESLVVYPVMYLAGIGIQGKDDRVDHYLVGVAIFLGAFSLLPLWPFLFCYLLWRWYLRRPVKETVFVIAVLSILLFAYINPGDWFQNTIVNNVKYFLPYDSGLSFLDIFKLIFFPFTALFGLGDILPRVYLLLLGYFIFILKISRLKKLILYFLLIILNNRITNPAVGFYTAFHLLPQLAFFVGVVMMSKPTRWLLVCFTLIMVVSGQWLPESAKLQKTTENFINYGQENKIAAVLSAIKSPADTLLAGPQEGFINLAAGIPLATELNSYLPWAYRVPRVRSSLTRLLANPPAFIYFPVTNNPFLSFLSPMLAEKYSLILNNSGEPSGLYILTTRLKTVDPKAKQSFESNDLVLPLSLP